MHLCGKQLLLQKYFTSYLTGTCFSSFLRSHLEAEIFKKILYSIYNVLFCTRSRITFLKYVMDLIKCSSDIQPVVIRYLVPNKTLVIVYNTFFKNPA